MSWLLPQSTIRPLETLVSGSLTLCTLFLPEGEAISSARDFLTTGSIWQIKTKQLIINSDLSETLSYAAWQNSVPLLRQLQLRNETETDLQKLTVNLISKPPFVTTKQWKVDELKIGETVEITDRDLEFDADYLRGLNEAERGQIVVTVTSEEW